ncbi:InlB B-repeat-containing protein [Aquirufa sp. TARAVU-A1A]
MKKIIYLLVIAILSTSCSKEILQHKLTVDAIPSNGGSVTPPSNSYENGQSVNLLATPAGEYVFKEWKGDLTGTLNPSTIIIDKDKQATGVFEKRQYPLNLTIEGNGTVKEEIIAVASQSQYPSGTTVRLTPQPLEGWEFSGWSGDISSISKTLDLKIVTSIALKATFSKLTLKSLIVENPIDTLIISKKHKYKIKGVFSNNSTIDLSSVVSIKSTDDKINLISDNSLIGKNSGNTKIQVSYQNFVVEDDLYVHNIEFVPIDSRLKSTGKGQLTVPVVIINYLPTTDGVYLDMKRAPDGYWDLFNSTLENVKLKILEDKIVEKNAIEEGTKFRDYARNVIEPYVNMDIVGFINVYELELTNWIKAVSNNQEYDLKTIDYLKLFKRLNVKNYVDNKGVKEIWFTIFPKDAYPSVINNNLADVNTYYGLPESNMSSPITGDISNSYYNQNDLPIYSKTYVVYGNSGHRGADTDLHNRGHQIEAQLAYLNNSLIWSNAFLPTSTVKQFRLGNCHWPPNATADYDYSNKLSVKSDIATWQPSGGNFVDVNVDTWLHKTYSFNMEAFGLNGIKANYSNDAQVKWFIYWWQSIPGLGNQIKYNGKQLNNWWDLFYNWDDAIKNKKTLWVE